MTPLGSGVLKIPSGYGQDAADALATLDHLPQMIWTMGPDGANQYFNRAWRDYTGTGTGTRIGAGTGVDEPAMGMWLDWMHPQDRDQILVDWRPSPASNAPFQGQYRLRHRSGEFRWFLVQIVCQQNTSGKCVQWIGSCTEIHEQQIRQIALAEDTKLQREMLDASIDCIKVIHPNGLLSTMNRAGCLALGVSGDSGFGMEWLNLLPPEIRVPGREALAQVRQGKSARFAGKSQLPGQAPQYWDNLLTPQKDADGNVTSILCVSRDVTLQRKAEEALIRSEKLAAASRLAASVSHGINNPLEAVTNLLFLLEQEPDLTLGGREFLQQAQAELARVSQAAIRSLQFYRQSTNASQVLLEEQLDLILGFYATRLRTSSIAVQKRYRHQAPVVSYGGELRQVFTNLIGNALDAMEGSGCLRLRTRCVGGTVLGRDYAVVTIADDGTGMSHATLASSFEPFFTTKGITGTGLGLWISQSIIEKHGGFIRVRSSKRASGHGSVFQVWIPIQPSPGLVPCSAIS